MSTGNPVTQRLPWELNNFLSKPKKVKKILNDRGQAVAAHCKNAIKNHTRSTCTCITDIFCNSLRPTVRIKPASLQVMVLVIFLFFLLTLRRAQKETIERNSDARKHCIRSHGSSESCRHQE